MIFFYCNGLTECPMTLLPFIIIQHAHFWLRHIPACSWLQIGHIHGCCWCWRLGRTEDDHNSGIFTCSITVRWGYFFCIVHKVIISPLHLFLFVIHILLTVFLFNTSIYLINHASWNWLNFNANLNANLMQWI